MNIGTAIFSVGIGILILVAAILLIRYLNGPGNRFIDIDLDPRNQTNERLFARIGGDIAELSRRGRVGHRAALVALTALHRSANDPVVDAPSQLHPDAIDAEFTSAE